MSSQSSNGRAATKRLLHELRSNEEDPNPALLFLRPVNEDNLFLWEAVLNGVPGTAYQGTKPPLTTAHLKLQINPSIPIASSDVCNVLR